MNVPFHISPSSITRLLIAIGFLLVPFSSYSQSEIRNEISEASNIRMDSITQLVNDYSDGFVTNDFSLLRNSIGHQIIMINGNFSGAPVNWQAHQFLNGKEIDDWIVFMFTNAAPFENVVKIKNVSVRGNSAIVATEERGQNKFRSWKNEEVVYMLGKTSQIWKIIGIFIKNLKNPD